MIILFFRIKIKTLSKHYYKVHFLNLYEYSWYQFENIVYHFFSSVPLILSFYDVNTETS